MKIKTEFIRPRLARAIVDTPSIPSPLEGEG